MLDLVRVAFPLRSNTAEKRVVLYAVDFRLDGRVFPKRPPRPEFISNV